MAEVVTENIGAGAVQAEPPESCRGLANCKNILDRLIEELARAGLTGEDRAAKLLYLALTSRILTRPVSIAVKGPSSAGKSFTVEQVLQFFPESAYYTLTGMSQKALAYSRESLVHRVLVIFEAMGMRGGTLAYFMRSLLSEGSLRWETVQKIAGRMQTVVMKRDGPTGLITTTTLQGLHPENETRMLSVTVNDSPEQTRAVMRAIASGKGEVAVDYKPWIALQEWIQKLGGKTIIPFGEQLAGLVLPVAIRLRRDFSTIMNLVTSHALLHRANREVDGNGAVVVTVEDYGVVRGLVADLVAEGVAASVPPIVRETVHAVERLLPAHPDGVSLPLLCEALDGLDASTVSRRVASAEKNYYLLNLEQVQGRPAKLVLGEPMPEDREVLPLPEQLAA